MTEQWKSVVGYEDSYEVSDQGNVRSLDRWRPNRFGQRLFPGQPVTQHVEKYGHRCVFIYRPGDGRRNTRWYVHRLVLLAFVGLCPDEHECCHKDGDPTNNHVDNLYWGTRSQNQLDSIRHGTHNSIQKARRTHCKREHEFTPANTTWIATNGKKVRRCRECTLMRQRKFYHQKKAAA